MFDLAVGIGVPSRFFGPVQQLWRLVDVAFHLVLLSIELNLELFKFSSLHQFIDDLDDALHALVGVRDLEVLKIFHFPRILGEVFRQRGITTAFGREKQPLVPEVYKEQGLLLILERDFIVFLEVLEH